MAGQLILMALGPFTFGLSTAAYQSLSRDTAHRWASAERIGRRPALQYVGPGAESIELVGVIHPHFKGGLGQLNKMRDLAGRAAGLMLVDGEGNVLGRWCIAAVRERQRLFLPGGAPREQRFNLTLRRFGEDAE
jgi:hypothetical protein